MVRCVRLIMLPIMDDSLCNRIKIFGIISFIVMNLENSYF